MITTPAQKDPLTTPEKKKYICPSGIVASDVTLCGLQHGQQVPGAASQEPNSVTSHCKANTTSTTFVMISFGKIHKYVSAQTSVSSKCCLSVICRPLSNREPLNEFSSNFILEHWSGCQCASKCSHLVTLCNSSGHFTWFSLRISLNIYRSEKYFEQMLRGGMKRAICVRYIIHPDAA